MSALTDWYLITGRMSRRDNRLTEALELLESLLGTSSPDTYRDLR